MNEILAYLKWLIGQVRLVRRRSISWWRKLGARTRLSIGLGGILILLPAVYMMMTQFESADAAWWDTGYGFRQRIPVSNASGSTQTDFQLELAIDTETLISAGKLQNDCDDLRFTAKDGKVLPYWLEPNTCNSDSTKVFVKIPSIPTSGLDIFYYYGNANAESASSTNHTFIRVNDAPLAAWPLDETTTTQSYSRVVNSSVETGRDILLNGDFSTTASWGYTAGGMAIENGKLNFSSAAQFATAYQTSAITAADVFVITYTISNYSAGGVRAMCGNAAVGTNRTANGTYTDTITCAGTLYFGFQAQSAGTTLSVDNVTAKMVSIPASYAISPTQLYADPDMEAATTASWTSVNGAVLSKQTTNPQQGSQVIRVTGSTVVNNVYAFQNVLTIGKTYRVTGYARSDGTATPKVGYNGTWWTGTTSTSWQEIDATFVADRTQLGFGMNVSAGTPYTEFDNMRVVEVSPFVGKPLNGVVLGSSSGTGGHLSNAYTFDGTNDVINIYSNELNSAFNQNEGTVAVWAKVSSSGIWTDGGYRELVDFSDSSSQNRVVLFKNTTSNQLTAWYVTGGTTKDIHVTTSTTGWFQLIVTWSKSNDRMRLYLNGAEVGSSQTGLGTWAANIASDRAAIGAHATSTPLSRWSGQINDVRLYDRALSAEEIAAQYSASSDIQAYVTDNYPDKELIKKYNPNITAGTFATEEVGSQPSAHWTLDEGQGTTVRNSSTRGVSGTITNAVWKSEAECISGKCLYFDGDGDYVSFGDNYDMGTGDMSISLWFRTNDTDYALISKSLYSSADNRYTLYYSGGLGALLDPNNNYQTTPLITTVNDSKWHHAETVFDRDGNMSIYVDGVLSASYSIASANGMDVQSAYHLFLGAYNDGSTGTNPHSTALEYQGYIDEVKIFPYARTAAQVSAEFAKYSTKAGRQAFMSDGLIGYWKMDETTWNGTANEVVDSSGTGRHGVSYQGGAVPVGGKYGNAAYLDGVNDFIDVTNYRPNASSFTVSAWYNISTASAAVSDILPIIGNGQNTPFLGYNPANKYYYHYRQHGSGSETEQWSYSPVIADSSWHHILLSVDQNTYQATLYLDGQQQTSQPIGTEGYTHGNGDFDTIGKDYASYFPGKLDEVRLYNRALTPAEATSLYRYAPGPIGHWKFDENTGTTAIDASGNGNTATLYNTASWTEGKYGSGIEFDATTDYALTTNANNLFGFGSGDFTIGLWMYPRSLPTYSMIMQKKSHTTNHNTNRFGLFPSGTNLYWDFAPGTGTLYTNAVNLGTKSSFLDKWSHITVTRSGDNLYGYVNGALVSTDTLPTGANLDFADDSFAFSLDDYTIEEYFNGKLDDVRVYNYARSDQQILEDMGASPLVARAATALPEPVAHFKLDEQNGQVTNNAGTGGTTLNGVLGTNSSVATDDPSWKTGSDCKLNGCLSFDGSNDFVGIATANDLNFGTGSFSFGGWIKFGAQRTVTPIVKGIHGYGSAGYRLYVNPASIMYLAIMDGTDACEIGVDISNVASEWAHYFGVWDAATKKCTVFVNGVPRSSLINTNVDSTTNNYQLLLGKASTGYVFGGWLDDIKLYNVALTAEQVKQDMNAGAQNSIGSTSTREAAQLTDGAGNAPIAEWKLDERTGTTANDTSGNSRTGTITGATWTAGKVGGALAFDGVGDYVSGFSANSLTQFTLEAWLQVDPSKGGSEGLWQVAGGGNAFQYVSVYKIGGNAGRPCWYIGNGWQCATTRVDDGNWHHVVYQFDNGAHYMWVDGKKEYDNSAGNGTYTSGNMSVLGAYSTGMRLRDFGGKMDNVVLYDYLRTPAQIAYTQNRGAPLVHWKMNECQGSTLNDSTGNSLTGTLTVGGSGTQTSIGTCDTSGSAWGNGSSGKFGAGMSLDGTDDYMTLNSYAGFNLSETTVAFWAKFNSINGAFLFDLASPRTVAHLTGTEMRWHTNGQYIDTSGANLQTGQWYHFTFTCSAANNTKKIYINGVEVRSTTGTGCATTSPSGAFKVGARYALDQGFVDGLMDDFRVYKYALSTDQIKHVMNEGAAVRFGD